MKIKGNGFVKSNYKVGDKIQLLERYYSNARYVPVQIIDIIDKGTYNMYLCKNLKSGCKTTFTDKELNDKIRNISLVRG